MPDMEKKTFWDGKLSLAIANDHIQVPTSTMDPFFSWSRDPEYSDPLDMSWLFRNGTTLLTGSGDLFGLAWWIIHAYNQTHYVLDINDRPIYIRGDVCPSESHFVSVLNQYNRSPISCCINRHNFQDFPPHIANIAVSINDVFFRWVVVNKEIAPWSKKTTNNCSRLRNALEITRSFPLLVILDNFSWRGNKKDFHEMLQYLKERKIILIMLNPTFPPKSFVGNAVWDNIIIANQWRRWRCSPQNMTLNIVRKEQKKENLKYRMKRDVRGNWIFIQREGYFLQPFVAKKMQEGRTAAEIVKFINEIPFFRQRLKKDLTTSTLAALKREWGLRTYKPETRPRKPKTSKRQKAAVALLDETI